MSIDDEFIQTIIANPDDDTPRLIYADWLEEQGDPRGEFIRIQRELAKMTEDDPRRWNLELRQGRLMRRYGWQWWFEPFNPSHKPPIFRRGFAEEVLLGATQFLERPSEYFAAYPLLRVLYLDRVRANHVAPLATLPCLDQLEKLCLSSQHRAKRLVARFRKKLKPWTVFPPLSSG